MRNKYIKIVLNARNELRKDIDISIGRLGLKGIKGVNVKIDTGCPYTSIPIQKIGLSAQQAQVMKQQDCNDITIKKEISFGVNDTQLDRIKAKELFRTGKYMQLKQITFIHNDLEMSFDGIVVRKKEVKVSYDRSGNILIGMDILKEWDIHIGTTAAGETIFLGCPKDQINNEYLQELKNTFFFSSSRSHVLSFPCL